MWISKLHFYVSESVFADLVLGKDTIPLKAHATDKDIVFTLENDSKIVCTKSPRCAHATLRQIDWLAGIAQKLPIDFSYEGVVHSFKYSHTNLALVPTSTKVRSNPSPFRGTATLKRIDTPRPTEPRPDSFLGLSHVGLFVSDVEDAKAFFVSKGFLLSDYTLKKNVFFRTAPLVPHHQLLLVASNTSPDDRCNLHHLAISVDDVPTVFTEGLGLASLGLKTALGPGRHIISSATFWYFHTTLGTVELCADEDILTETWEPRSLNPDAKISEWVATLSNSQTRVTSNEP